MEVMAAAGVMGNLDDQLGMSLSPAGSSAAGGEDEGDLRRGPWTVEEDVLLVNYIAKHGEGRWNSLARSAGLKRTGKSCRLRWLNYLRPDVRRGNITPEEQLLILELHSRWGNRWSKIAQHLPGRTDNEIKNYWRTRVQKHAKQLRCDVNSKQFRDVVRCIWMPRLVERIQAESAAAASSLAPGAGEEHDAAKATLNVPAGTACQMSTYGCVVPPPIYRQADHHCHRHHLEEHYYNEPTSQTAAAAAMSPDDTSSAHRSSLTAEASSHAHHLASTTTTPTNEGGVVQCGGGATAGGQVDGDDVAQDQDVFGGSWSELLLATTTGRDDSMIGLPDFELGDFDDYLWSLEDLRLYASSAADA